MADDAPLCKPIQLTRREAQLLITASGASLERMTKLLAGGAITGAEVHRRIDDFRRIIDKLNACVEDTEA